MLLPEIRIRHPDWIASFVDADRLYPSDGEKMRLAVALADENVRHGTGGPFGAAVFEGDSGRLVAVGTNSVVRLNNCALHAEIMALMSAQAVLGCTTLREPGRPRHVLATSCEPCAMCLGATLWSGVRRVVCGATREDAERVGFDEGPVFPASYEYLRERGVELEFEVLREQARRVLERYREGGGAIYNG